MRPVEAHQVRVEFDQVCKDVELRDICAGGGRAGGQSNRRRFHWDDYEITL